MSFVTTKSTLLSLAVIVSLSACGKSKDLKTPQAPPATNPTVAAPVTPAPTANAPTAPQPAPAAPGNPVPNTTQLLPGDNNSGFDNDVLPPLPMGPERIVGENSPTENSSVIRPPLTAPSNNRQKTAEINFKNQDAVKTGGKTQDLFYTSAGVDGLMNEFKSYGLKVSVEQQKMNANLAKAIVTAKLSRAISTGDITVELTIDESANATGAVKVYRLKATADSGMMKLSQTNSAGQALEFQGGFLKCLDADGGCENAYAKIKLQGAYTRIIFRNSYADMNFLIQENISGNFGFDLMKKYALSAAGGINTSERIDNMQVSSFEVTNGRSGMGALLTTKDKEMVGLSIPLVVSGDKSEVNSSVAKLSDLSRNYDLSALANSYSQKLSQQISDVKLVNNNGLGQLKLKMNFNQGANTGAIWIVVSKVQKTEFSLEQVRQFESKLKNF